MSAEGKVELIDPLARGPVGTSIIMFYCIKSGLTSHNKDKCCKEVIKVPDAGYNPFLEGIPLYSTGPFSTGYTSFAHASPSILPRVDVLETDTHIIYLLDMAGANPDKMNLEISPSEVVISSPMETDIRYPDATFLYQERPKGTFARILTPPANVDLDNVNADYRHGLLEISFPKKQGKM